MTLGELFAGIANAIRLKDGTTASIPATTFPERIMALSGGGGGGPLSVTTAGKAVTFASTTRLLAAETKCEEKVD
mgnify:CR=1 FL=1